MEVKNGHKNPNEFEEAFAHNIIFTTIGKAIDYCRSNSLWPLTFGPACCAIEMMCTGDGRHDLSRFGSEVFRASPRQADVMVVAGTISNKLAPLTKRLYDQMPDPKYVIAVGSCAMTGGPFADSYSVLKGVDKIIPVDVHVPGCPPRPEAILNGFIQLRNLIRNREIAKVKKSG